MRDCEAEEDSAEYKAHREHIAGTVFRQGGNLDRHGFSAGEIKVLDRYGYWMQALAEERIPAISKAQRRFLAVMTFSMTPEPPYETVWRKFLKHRRHLEALERNRLQRLKEKAERVESQSEVINRRLISEEQLARARECGCYRNDSLSYGKLPPY